MSIGHPKESNPEPAWDIARLFPDQGAWTVDDYLDLTRNTNRLIELDDGRIEVLAMPTEKHQLLVQFLLFALHGFATPRKLGTVLHAGLRVRTLESTYREPDIVFMRTENSHRRGNDFWDGADLVMEVVSPDDNSRRRDLEKKRSEYAAAGIPEYWIIDPHTGQVIVLTLAGAQYDEHGVFSAWETATSVLLEGFEVSVSDLFAAAEA